MVLGVKHGGKKGVKADFGEPKYKVKILWDVKRQRKKSPKIFFAYIKNLSTRIRKFIQAESRTEGTS
jgi:hypothetical protein